MSCHNIGMGLNSVVDLVVDLMDDKEISVKAARAIIAKCRRGVY